MIMQFIADSDFFIQAHRAFYPLDVVPGFWNKIREFASREELISIDKVKEEIYRNEDQLKEWIQTNLDDSFFKDTQSQEVLYHYTRIVNWAQSKSDHYKQRAIDDFMVYEKADAWLVAFAATGDYTIVTQEVSDPNRKSRIKIPDVCLAFNITTINTMELFRKLGAHF